MGRPSRPAPARGTLVCSFVQLCTAKVRSVGGLGTVDYRVSDMMFYTTDSRHWFGGGTASNNLNLPAACSGLAAPGPQGNTISFRCCRGKG